MIYDIVIIGSGISGLYAAYSMSRSHPQLSCIILEKEHEIGGRIHSESFYGEEVKMGGGIVRENDMELRKLLHQLHIHVSFSIHFIQHISPPIDIIDIITKTRRIYEKNHPYYPYYTTFRTYAQQLWGKSTYEQFIKSNMYDDFQTSSIKEVLFNYDFSLNTSGYKEGSINWNQLLARLDNNIPYPIITNCQVNDITKQQTNTFMITTSKGILTCKKIICATPVHVLSRFFPNRNYDYLIPSPSIKVYAKVSKSSISIMKKHVAIHTIVPTVLKNIIPIHKEKGIYVIAYSDEEDAIALSHKTDDTKENRKFYSRLLEQSLQLPNHSITCTRIIGRYWPYAMYTTSPYVKDIPSFLYDLQRPDPMIRVIGEAVGEHGWVGGAIDTVPKVITTDWLDT